MGRTTRNKINRYWLYVDESFDKKGILDIWCRSFSCTPSGDIITETPTIKIKAKNWYKIIKGREKILC